MIRKLFVILMGAYFYVLGIVVSVEVVPAEWHYQYIVVHSVMTTILLVVVLQHIKQEAVGEK
jgi:uncharacterized protein (DUF983 family)